MTTRSKILRTLVVLGVLACIAGAGVFSAFSSQTDSPENVVTAGTVKLGDNDAGAAVYKLTNAKPGDSQTSCIKVTYTGTLDAAVRFYTPTAIGPLGSSVNLKVEPGTQTGSPSFPSCANFTPDAGGALFEGTLSSFAAEHSAYANGVADFPGSSSKWATNDSVVYRVMATLAANAPDSAQGQSTGEHILRWEAQNQ
jgi:predicted ribosomally synthesized peptide with SipW-like signal peptide